MFKTLVGQRIARVYHIKQYKEFPFKRDSDKVVRVYPTLEEACSESEYLNTYDIEGKRYYAVDYPHEFRKADDKLEREYKRKLKVVIDYIDELESEKVRAIAPVY